MTFQKGEDETEIVMVGAVDIVFTPIEQTLLEAGHHIIRLRSASDFEHDRNVLKRASVLLTDGALPVTAARMASTERLRAIISVFTGTEGIDEAAATEHNIIVGNGQIAESYESMAEATIMLMLACLYDLPAKQFALQTNGHAVARSRMLRGRTVGLLGYGRISREIVRRLAPWQARIIATSRSVIADDPGVEQVSLHALLRESDLLCVLAPLNGSTRMLLDKTRLQTMKQGSSLIVTSRGGIVDESALAELVEQGHLAHVALDVFDTEPLSTESPLRGLRDAILTPHSVGHTLDTIERLPGSAVESVLRVLQGLPPLHVRNPAVLDRWQRAWSGSGGADASAGEGRDGKRTDPGA